MFCEHVPENALCSVGEVCLAAVGCIDEPPSTCATDAECASDNACAAVWRCEPEFGCAFVSALDCDDADACTIDSCDGATGCVHEPPDVDGDGFVDAACDGEDCGDSDDTVSPSAPELCGDGIDQDCDRNVDEGCCEAGLPCTTSCSTTGMTSCMPDGSPGPCVPPAELCNGIDDDCDGMRDEACCVAGSPCTTTCGSTGTTACAPDGTASCVPPAEICNDRDDDCDMSIDDGFACRVGTSTACTTACGSTGTRACLPGCSLDGTCAPPAEICNGVDDDCDSTCDDGFTCCAGSSRACSTFGFFAGTALCRGDCSGFDTSTCSNCGNGTRNMGEQCDGVDLGGATCTSLGMGFSSGTLRCAAGCVYDTSSCSRCGNGAIDSGEQCDGSMLGGATCGSIGMGFAPGGTLSCGPSCTYVTSGCTRCGNGTIDAGEQCDGTNLGGSSCTTVPGGFTGGTLRCGATCTSFDTSMCTRPFDPTGTYTVTPAPAYSCAFGLVGFNLGTLQFVDNGTTLSVLNSGTGSPGLPCSMQGASARASRMFDVSCLAPGSCNETYRLVGSYTGDSTWTGTFTATYTGSCFGCSYPSQSVTGRR
jgi:hypothetical protein